MHNKWPKLHHSKKFVAISEFAKKSSKANKTDQKKSWAALQMAFGHVLKTNDDVR